MDPHKTGLAIIFHSGSYDRIYHGLSLALAASALGREAKLFFSYWSLEYFRKRVSPYFRLDKKAETFGEIIEKNIKQGHMLDLNELVRQAKAMGVKFYSCTSSMGLLNIARDELLPAIDKSMGITTFLSETQDFQLIFI
ncbi:MAG: DsrE/DsrF/DrsH-like family protein [Candidatus Omnitrophota bacterium]